MLISPLMGPIFGMGLAIALGNFYTEIRSETDVILGVVASVLLAATITRVLPSHGPSSEILSRVQTTSLDLVICRGGGGQGHGDGHPKLAEQIKLGRHILDEGSNLHRSHSVGSDEAAANIVSTKGCRATLPA